VRTSTRLLLVPAILVTAIALAGCSLGGGAKDSASDKSSSSSSSKSDTKATDEKTADTAASTGGCPAALTAALKTQSNGEAKEGAISDLAYPGDASLLADACVIVSHSSSGDSVMAFIPGDAAKATSIDAGLEAAGFSALTKDDKSAYYTKDKESWIVATSAASNPVTSAFGDKFSGPLVTVVKVVTA
jgi:hypothetical protein